MPFRSLRADANACICPRVHLFILSLSFTMAPQGSSEPGIHPASLTPRERSAHNYFVGTIRSVCQMVHPNVFCFQILPLCVGLSHEVCSSFQRSAEIHLSVSLVEDRSCPSLVRILMCLINGAVLENTVKSCCLSSCCLSFSHTGVLSIQIFMSKKRQGEGRLLYLTKLNLCWRLFRFKILLTFEVDLWL